VVTVGEPPAAGLNSFGNAEVFPLPHGGLSLHVSAVYHQYTDWSEHPGHDPGLLAVDFPIFPTAEAYFSGHDPALDFIFSGADLRPLWAIATAETPETLRTVYEARKAAYGRYDWWRPVAEEPMNSAGNDLRRDGAFDKAIAALTINTEVYPDSWNTWDSLGEAYFDGGDYETAQRHYEKSLEVNPGNHNAQMMLDRITDKLAESGGE